MSDWIKQAVNGNTEYFLKQPSEYWKNIKDEYDMTPLMYAVLGQGYIKPEIVRTFLTFSDKTAKNFLDHTAYDIFMCIADGHASQEIFEMLSPYAKARKAARTVGGILDLAFLAASKITDLPLYTNMGDDSNDFLTALTKFHSNTSSLFLEIGDYLSEEERKLQSIQRPIDKLSIEYELFAKYRVECLKDKANKLRNELYSSTKQDEFETTAEYNDRIEKIVLSTYGTLDKLSENDIEMLHEKAILDAETKVEQYFHEVKECEHHINNLKKAIELIGVYAVPPKASCMIGRYDIEKNVFPIMVARHKLELHICRDEARQLRENLSNCKFEIFRTVKGIDYNLKVEINLEQKQYTTNLLQHSLLITLKNNIAETKNTKPDFSNMDIKQLIGVMSSTYASNQYKSECLPELYKRIKELDNDELFRYERLLNSSQEYAGILRLLQQEKNKRGL